VRRSSRWGLGRVECLHVYSRGLQCFSRLLGSYTCIGEGIEDLGLLGGRLQHGPQLGRQLLVHDDAGRPNERSIDVTRFHGAPGLRLAVVIARRDPQVVGTFRRLLEGAGDGLRLRADGPDGQLIGSIPKEGGEQSHDSDDDDGDDR
jgi:hypothetical protein